MSKKYSKWLVGAALLGAAAGAGLAYFKKHKKEKENWEDDFEYFEDDFLDDDLEDFDGEDAADAREYVTIPSSSVPEEAAENAADTAEAIFEKEEEETVKAEAEEPKETAEAVTEHAEAESKPEDADEEETVPEEAEEMVADAAEEKSEEETPEA